MTSGARPISTQGIERATGRMWADWTRHLDERGARELPHPDIAALALAEIQAGPDAPSNPEWWAQSVTVAYEQHIGRRLPGQRPDGTFDASVSKTVIGTMDEAVAALAARHDGASEINGVAMDGAPSVSATEKWRYWRARLADGSTVQATINDSGSGKARIGLQHGKLSTPEDAVAWKAFWKGELARL